MAWTLSKTWKQRPSEIYRLDDEYAAYCFDKAIMSWGLSYEADLNDASGSAKTTAEAKRKMAEVQRRWLADEIEAPAPSAPDDGTAVSKFKDPASKFRQ